MKNYACAAAAAAIICTAAFIFALIGRSVPASADMSGEVTLPVLMYHSVLEDPSRTGEYVITPQNFENDLKYLNEHGYTSVTPQDIIDFTDKGTPLPDKPVFITFDDGHLNNLTYALPLLEKYDMYAEINVVGAFTLQAEKENDPNPFYAYLTRDDIRKLCESGRIDIGCHTYNMHSLNGRQGASRKSSETAEDYISALRTDISEWQNLFSDTCIYPTVYAYPYGFKSEEGYDVILENNFRIILTCREQTNDLRYISGSKNQLIIIDRFNRSGLVQTDEFMSRYDIC